MVKSLAGKKSSSIKLGEFTNGLTNALIDFFQGFDLDVVPRTGTLAEYYDKDLSIASVVDNKVNAAMLVRRLDEQKIIEISALACQNEAKAALFGLGGNLFNTLFAECPDYSLRFAAVNEASENLTNELFKDGLKREMIRTAVWMEI